MRDVGFPLLISTGYYTMALVKSREFPRRSDIERTQRILVHSGLGLLLSVCDFNAAWPKGREFLTHFLKPKDLDAFCPEAAWLSYLRWTMMASVGSREIPI